MTAPGAGGDPDFGHHGSTLLLSPNFRRNNWLHLVSARSLPGERALPRLHAAKSVLPPHPPTHRELLRKREERG